jgi:hypothetical protein
MTNIHHKNNQWLQGMQRGKVRVLKGVALLFVCLKEPFMYAPL